MKLKSFRTNAAFILTTLMLVFAATTVATAQTYKVISKFDGTDGSEPLGVLAQGRDGNLYGTTSEGGTNDDGVVFRVTPGGTETVLYNFDDGTNGGDPQGGLTLSADGNFYGTTHYGGADGDGTIFKITPSESLTTLYSFTDGTDGGYPGSPPIQGTDGNFYGTTEETAYKITPSGTFKWLAILPWSPSQLIQGTDGYFYGTTDNSYATAFRMTPKGTLKTVYNFPWDENPDAPVIQGSDGNLYGTTEMGGSNVWGVVYKLTTRGAITVLHNFPDPNYPNDGYEPGAGLVQATDGNFYGTTFSGGTAQGGVIFQITPADAYSILYDFDYAVGSSALMQHTNGKTYGVTWGGGTLGDGVVYSLDMGLAPFVSLVRTSGKVGHTRGILGQGFTGTTAVSFNGTAASFTVKSDTYLTAIVPSGATTGFVTVTTPSGTLTSNKQFRVKR